MGGLLIGCAPSPEMAPPPCLPGGEAIRFLSDLAAGSEPSRLKQLTATPSRESIRYGMNGRTYEADLYRGAEAPLAGVLLVPGAAQQGKDDPRLVALARTLARSRFAVMVPDMKQVRDLKARPEDVQEIVDAFTYLIGSADLSPQGRAGISAHSYAVGPAILAAMRPEIRDHVRFVQGVGGYHDLAAVVTYFTTGYFRRPGETAWRYLAPSQHGKWTFMLSNADQFSQEGDRQAIAAIARRRMAEPGASIDDLATQLGHEGRAFLSLLDNPDPARTPALLRQIPAAMQADLAALDLASRDLHPLRARLILVHGVDDSTIPYTESLALAHAVRPGQARLFLVRGLSHVDLRGFGVLDHWRLLCAVEALLAERRLDAP